MRITRRQLLAAGLAVAAAGAAGLGAVGASWWDRAPGAGLLVLSTDEHAFIQAIAEAWMPAGGEPALSGADAALGDWFDAVLSGMPGPPRRQLKLLLHGLDCLPIPTHASRYTTLQLQDRQEVLHGWLHSDQYLLRSAVQAVMVLVGLGWSTHPAVAEGMRPWFGCGFGR
jgi:hypothetical protein